VVLRQLEQGGRRDDGGGGPGAQDPFGVGQQGRQHQGRKLLGQQRLAGGFEGDPLLRPHEALEFRPGVGGVGLQEAVGPAAHDGVAARVDPHHGRGEALAQIVGDHRDGRPVESGRDRVRRAEIDA
jgi:hypothetical protein